TPSRRPLTAGPCSFRDAETLLIPALVGRDQFGQEADRHHLRAQQQRGHGINQQRTLMKRPEAVRHPVVDEPRNREINHGARYGKEAQQANAAEQVLRPLPETGQELDGEQVEKPFHEAADAVLGMPETPRPMVDFNFAYAEAARRREDGNEPMKLAVKAYLPADLGPKTL